MTSQPNRNASGGIIDRARPLDFIFNGRRYQGYEGDSLASALLANGVKVVGRSFKYHRPRGVMTAGPEEPNALVQLGEGARSEPNLRATEIPLTDGLVARSQNCWPSVDFDVGAVTNLFSRLFPAGFYYKTFMAPARLWMTYERQIRRMAGMGEGPRKPDPDTYDRHYGHADVLVVGGGAAGLAAALAAGRSGARVVLADLDGRYGGQLLSEPAQSGREIDGKPALDWVAAAEAELAALAEVTLLRRTTAFGYFDHDLVGLCQQEEKHQAGAPRQRIHYIRAKQVVLASGAIERPLVFADNDRPGHMLASAARSYANRYGVAAGRRAVVFTNNDTAYEAARDLAAAGIALAAVVDLRPSVRGDLVEEMSRLGVEVMTAHAIVATRGAKGVSGVDVMALDEAGGACKGPKHAINCDLVLSSGGWSPTVHLYSHAQGKLRYDPVLAAFLPDHVPQAISCAGAVNGKWDLPSCLAEGAAAGAAAAKAAGFSPDASVPEAAAEAEQAPLRSIWQVPLAAGSHAKRFVDHQDDVATSDVALAVRENYRSVEHLKRYTTLGMGTDQGKTSNINGLGILAGILDRPLEQVGTTTFRPPYTPVTMGAIANRECGPHLAPKRRSPIHAWHAAQGAVFVEAGQWYRPRYYPRSGEGLTEAARRETRHVRQQVGMCDVSTLGKIDIQGKDAKDFLNRIYINGFAKLPVGKARYGVMLREDGIVYDDGTTTRLAENHYLMTTTTANAGRVMTELEYLLQVVWPELDVAITSVTDLLASMSIAGPKSRDVLQALDGDIDFSNEGLVFMGHVKGTLAGIPADAFRISFSGELAYEVAVPSDYGAAMWEAIMAAGEPFGLAPYGTEALGLLRIEKGHVVIGAEINGTTTAQDLGFGRMTSTKKAFIGQRSLAKPAFVEAGRHQLVGLKSVDGVTKIPSGAQLVTDPNQPIPMDMQGHVTSGCFSPNLNEPIAIALLADGQQRMGEELTALSPVHGTSVPVRVVSPHFIDPEGERLRA